MIPFVLKCGKCDGEIMDRNKLIADVPSVKLGMEIEGRPGTIWLCAIYGDYAYECNMPVVQGTVVRFFCPNCNEEMKGLRICDSCGAPMIPLVINMGGEVEICCRSGCKNHFIEFKDIEDTIRFYEAYNIYFRPAP